MPGAERCTIPAGNRIPGIARDSLYAALAWVPPPGWRGGVEARALSQVCGERRATPTPRPAYATVSAQPRLRRARRRRSTWRGFARVDNLFDRSYAGSVIVNEGNGRFFEPAPRATGPSA